MSREEGRERERKSIMSKMKAANEKEMQKVQNIVNSVYCNLKKCAF